MTQVLVKPLMSQRKLRLSVTALQVDSMLEEDGSFLLCGNGSEVDFVILFLRSDVVC